MDVNTVLAALGWIAGWILILLAPSKPSPPDSVMEVQGEEGSRSTSDIRSQPRTVSVIIPARNEEKRLPYLLDSLQGLPSFVELIVADDNSSDDTHMIAERFRARVIEVPPVPEGWLGKPWACWNGAQFAGGEWLVFVDADVVISRGRFAALIADLDQGTLETALTIQPWHFAPSLAEQFSVWFNMLVWMGTSRRSSEMRGGFGPCLIVARSAYFRVDGHRAVASVLLENSYLASLLAAHGLEVTNHLGDPDWQFRMYPGGTGEVVSGWSKHFATGARESPRLQLLLVMVWITGVGAGFTDWFAVLLHSFADLSAGLLVAATLVVFAYGVQISIAARRVGSFRWYTAAFYPIFLTFFLVVFAYSLMFRRRTRVWKGREIPVQTVRTVTDRDEHLKGEKGS